ncbi:5-formyltetrahydrofolate cyclo-ligase [Chiayiivirga flava]|uniref:5-formyltetrahydrofolate cyclo-ligase n=1 Tax=Chiayiivirga flava TaxID=659595 RepID=A0A7W8D5L9_9GAMM|nr:5-formyltetrahydrofolate cyclo-ligase [Chiayiivirga flava]MBB5207972.1 5-formyltetrahydrofolate cyclo-ligase [Chiayiivirga flava]
MTAPRSDRRAVREQMRARRSALPAAQRLAAADAVARHVRSLDAVRDARYLAGYWATGGEVPLHALLVPAPGFVYCLPCLTSGNALLFAPWRAGDALVQNRYGIPEPDLAPSSCLPPDAMDVVLVPLLAFTTDGVRLGAGGGYYDRSFAFLQAAQRAAKPLLVGVGYAFQQHDGLQAEPWDVGLDYIATERALIRCR